MKFRDLVAVVAAVAFSTPHAHAQPDPVITPNLLVRGTNATASTEGSDPGSDDEFIAMSEQSGTFDRMGNANASGDKGSTASADVKLDSDVSNYTITAKGDGNAQTSISSAEGDAGSASISYFQILFSVPVDTEFSIYGTFEATSQGVPPTFGIESQVSLSIQGADPEFTPFNITETADANDGELVFFHTQRVKGGTQIVLQFQAQAIAGTLDPGTSSGGVEFFFRFDVRDQDKDGLLDTWETDGIDLNGDGTLDLDLNSLGADPEKKTLFVELDSQTGVPVDAQAVNMVEQAFANAPASAADNPDGSAGVDLFFVIDESNLPSAIFGVGADGFASGFDAQKANHYGTTSLRNDPEWDTIKKAYRKVFRYCIWGNSIVDSGGSAFSGISELPGNDFFVAGGVIPTWYSDPALARDALAGTLMHEFGHALGLRHGGNENTNYKPNYLSVMNYAYQMPYDQESIEGTNLADVWFLDYARTSPNTLDENALDEQAGFNGPSGKKMIFNIMPDGFDPQLEIVDADAAEIDWDLTASIEADPIAADINRFEGSTDSLDSSLTAPEDWSRIIYPIGDNGDFADGSHSSSGSIERFTFDDFQRISSFTVHDRSAGVCRADVNADGVLDLGDIQAFVDLFLASDLAADFNPDGVLDTGDITAFVQAFLEGC